MKGERGLDRDGERKWNSEKEERKLEGEGEEIAEA